jgi:hypothetical protein
MIQDLAKAARLQTALTKSYAKLIREGWSNEATRDELMGKATNVVKAKTGIRPGHAGFGYETALLFAEVYEDAKRLNRR